MTPPKPLPDVRLRIAEPGRWPLIPGDLGALYHLMVADDTIRAWRYNGYTPDPDDFVKDLWQNVALIMMMEDGDGHTLGMCRLYSPRPEAGYAYFEVMIALEYQRTLLPWEGMGMFFDHVFSVFNWLEKIYIEAVDVNFARYASILTRAGATEKIIRPHVVPFLGERRDLIVCQINQDDWAATGWTARFAARRLRHRAAALVSTSTP